MQEGSREFLCCDVEWCRPRCWNFAEGVASSSGFTSSNAGVFTALWNSVTINPTVMSEWRSAVVRMLGNFGLPLVG
jgi:hypothetical protein